MSIQLLKKPLKKNLIIGIATAFVLLLIGVGYTANIKANEHKKLEETCTTNKNVDDCQKACDAGSAEGCFELGGLYIDGEGVKQDITKAVHYYKKACDAGKAEVCSALGFSYKKGKGVKQDFSKSAHFFQKGCDGGDTFGCLQIGILYARGLGVKKDLTKATQSFKKACDGGDAIGCEGLKALKQD